jgi:copper chaperone CopZ
MTERLEVTVAKLDCADEAQQIEAALGRLDGVAEISTASVPATPSSPTIRRVSSPRRSAGRSRSSA